MAKKTAFDDLFSDDFGKLGLQRLEELNAMALTLKENLKASAQTLSAKVRGASPSTASGAKEIENTKKEVEDLKKQSAELAKIQEKLNKATSDAAKEQAQYNLELKRQNQLNRENAILESEKSTQYEKNVVLLNRLSKQIMALGGTDKAPKELADEFNRLFGEVKNAEESVKRFQRNVGNYASATAELKALTKQLIDLELAGQRDSAAFREMQKRAAELKDTISDTKAEISNMASDTKTIDGLVGSVNLLANGFQVAEGAMALMGESGEEWKETMVKLQAIMAVTSGIQEIQNALQKESAAMMFLNSVRTKAAAAAQSLYAFATGGATVATKAFRIALISTGIGAIVVLLGSLVDAMGFFDEETEKATDTNNKLNESILATSDAYSQLSLSMYNHKIRMAELNKEYTKMFVLQQQARSIEFKKQINELNNEYKEQLDLVKDLQEEEKELTAKRDRAIKGLEIQKNLLKEHPEWGIESLDPQKEYLAEQQKNLDENQAEQAKILEVYNIKKKEIEFNYEADIEYMKEKKRIEDEEKEKDSLKKKRKTREDYAKKKMEQEEKEIMDSLNAEMDLLKTEQEIQKQKEEADDAEWQAKVEMNEKQMDLVYEQIEEEDRLRKLAEEKEKESFERRKQFAQEALQFMEKISEETAKAKLDAIDKELSASEERESQLKTLAQQGQLNAQQSIALEEKRQAELESKREKALKRQREQAIILAGIEAFIASARAGSTNPSGDATNQVNGLLSNLEGALNKIKAFEKGGLVDGGEQLVRINEKGEEFVVKHDAVNKYGEQMLYDINEGRFNPLDYVSTPSQSAYSFSEPISTKVVEKLERVEEAIRTKPVPSWSVSEITKGVREDIREGNNLLRKHYERGNKLF